MKLLHTSDWHIGRTLYGRKRYEEFETFLNWLADTIQREGVDILLVAGDVFDTSAPSNRAQQLYYRFLCRMGASSCRHVVLVAGNHDSPSFLNAPKELLKTLDVHVVGNSAEAMEEEVLVLRNGEGDPEMIVCAVPYLRDRDVRTAEPGESVEDKERRLVDGIEAHYAAATAIAEGKRQELGADIPIVAMGHLFTAGGQTVDGDGVRELYVGSLAHVTAGIFPARLDYLALGHLHVPQKVGGRETIRYSGSPLPMGFGEAKQAKSVVMVDFGFALDDLRGRGDDAIANSIRNKQLAITLVPVPVFQPLESVKGDWDSVSGRILELKTGLSQAWLEVVYEGDEVIADLRERLDTAISGSQMEILRIKNNRVIDRMLEQFHEEETLDNLNEDDVFQRCLAAHNVPDDQRPELLLAYQEVLLSIYEG